MKKTTFLFSLFMAIVMMAMSSARAWAQTAKAVYDNGTLTFYYDDVEHSGTTYALNTGSNKPGWNTHYLNLASVVFDESFASVRPTSCYMWFANCSFKLTSITGIEYLNTEEVTNMSQMFRNCSKLTSLDVSKLNTANVTDMSEMFYKCSGLFSLDVTKFNTANVKDMNSMFRDCSKLTSLDVSKFNTANVTNMDGMFNGCSKLTSLDVTKFNTDNVTDMGYMFYACSGLTSLDLSSFNTANVTDMRYMFYACSGLTSLDLSNFNTAKVQYMNEMFHNCSQLSSLTIGNFDMQKTSTTSNMFSSCTALNTLTLKSVPFINAGYFDTQFAGKTVNYELDDNSVIYIGANNLPTATSVTYTRNIVKDGGKYSFIVPFNIPTEEAAVLGKFYKYDRHADGTVYFAEETEGVKANTAYFFDPETTITSITVENTQVESPSAMPNAANASEPGLYGTYSQIAVPVGAYGYGADGSFVKAGSGNTLRPFRAYLWLGSDVSMAKARAFWGNAEDVTAIELIGADGIDLNAPVYNLRGQRIAIPMKGEIYIQNGKKVIKN